MKKNSKNVNETVNETVKEKPVDTVKVEKTAEKPVEITGLTVKGIPENAVKEYGAKLKNGKENSAYIVTENGVKYLIPVNFDSFDVIVKSIDMTTATAAATYKIRENGKTVSEISVRYGGDGGEKFSTYRAFYDRKGTGGIDTAIVEYIDGDGVKNVILYVNRASKFREIKNFDIVRKAI